jgi:hypothetical protein
MHRAILAKSAAVLIPVGASIVLGGFTSSARPHAYPAKRSASQDRRKVERINLLRSWGRLRPFRDWITPLFPPACPPYQTFVCTLDLNSRLCFSVCIRIAEF